MDDKKQELYVINAEDFERFAYQMIVTFPFMPDGIRKEWSDRINRVRAHVLSDEINTARDKLLDEFCDKIWVDPMTDDGLASMNKLGEIIQSLRSNK